MQSNPSHPPSPARNQSKFIRVHTEGHQQVWMPHKSIIIHCMNQHPMDHV